MFFHTGILARKGPLSVIWLAAHYNKRLTRAQIESQNVGQIVDIIKREHVPTSLRTTSELLVGVCWIFYKQVLYANADLDKHIRFVATLMGNAHRRTIGDRGGRRPSMDQSSSDNLSEQNQLIAQLNIPDIDDFIDANPPPNFNFLNSIEQGRARITMMETPPTPTRHDAYSPDDLLDNFGEPFNIPDDGHASPTRRHRRSSVEDLFNQPDVYSPIPQHSPRAPGGSPPIMPGYDWEQPDLPPLDDRDLMPPPPNPPPPPPPAEQPFQSPIDRFRAGTSEQLTAPRLILEDLSPDTLARSVPGRGRRRPRPTSGDESPPPVSPQRPRRGRGGRGGGRRRSSLIIDNELQLRFNQRQRHDDLLAERDRFVPHVVVSGDGVEDLFAEAERSIHPALRELFVRATRDVHGPAPGLDSSASAAASPTGQGPTAGGPGDDGGLFDEPIPPLDDSNLRPGAVGDFQMPHDDLFDQDLPPLHSPQPPQFPDDHDMEPQDPRAGSSRAGSRADSERPVATFLSTELDRTVLDGIFRNTLSDTTGPTEFGDFIHRHNLVVSRERAAALFARLLDAKERGEVELRQKPELQWFEPVLVVPRARPDVEDSIEDEEEEEEEEEEDEYRSEGTDPEI